jgi:NAD(P)-dependent dehydrogenase (short-subunit alcohol dehydrogenase family)
VILRADLLEGRAIAVGGAVHAAVRERLLALGARVEVMPGDERVGELVPADEAGGGSEPAARGEDEDRVGAWARRCGPLDAVVYDAGAAFGEGGEEALLAALEDAWVAVREVATGALIPGDTGGKVLLIGPRPDAGAFAQAARAALENLARTLSVEWARYGVTAAMIAPGPASTDQQLAELVCFLVSEAGGYVSGCRLELGALA